MVTAQRILISNAVRTNGATPNPWWSNAVVYQVYPRSFQDTNGDGFGDIKGITSRLDYLADLGVDVVWLSPVFKSPQDDNGYDISDYQDIDPMFGTLGDMDELLAEAHRRGIKIIMDLVVNHTSDEHAWFQASRDSDDPHADWYWWRPAKSGHEPGTPGAEPNQWGSYFGGSAWEYDPKRGEYFFHQYSKKQPDLNWENPEVRKAVYAMMNWWMDRGIDGFRMDVITQISKVIDENGKLPGEEGSLIADEPVGPEGYSSPFPFCSDGPRVDEFLAEMRREVFENREGYLNVGEAPGVTPSRNEHITDPANKELDMLFQFNHVGVDQVGSKWDTVPFEVKNLRREMSEQQKAVANAGWASLFFCNHDQPRVVSRWGDDSTEESRAASAKAFALLLHMHRGTPYVYQGEELGMTNAHFTTLDQYRDLEALNAYRQRVEEAKVQSEESMMDALALIGRDNARTPMQWDGSKYAGFTDAQAHREPWISVNPNHVDINAAAEFDDPDSVYSFYKQLIELRHTNQVVAAGDWQVIDEQAERVYAFTRSLGDERLLVMVNLSGKEAEVPAQSAALIEGLERGDFERQTLIGTHGTVHAAASLAKLGLSPWEGVAVRL
ncbi:glycoside hydrolase family 13 protein [Bifidobacterium tsurumiense]|uniref:glycoside hydrolase family 13 protein n=1 Tax=Bifidobacterium tsurumiense TaxID=356829 RepID=UPI0012B437C3|nr:alpha-glucosidase [Bifidobacterium tsurumiense]MDY4677482.1 alpha-glucosidase [Bifidobacterium tsurumiense]MSS13285.1 alpha-glucosidase [Bifidobacterium tsurumiense]